MTLTFPELLETLGYAETDHVSVCEQPPGGIFSSRVVPILDVFSVTVPTDRNAWFGVNPLTDPATWPPRADGRPRGRGEVEQVVRLVALFADLDAKDAGVGSFESAGDVIDTISGMLGSRPMATTMSGNGLQPFWTLEDPPTGLDAVALLRRFGRLVRRVAENTGGKVDSVYDLARVLRMPGSNNCKAEPKPVITVEDRGRPLEVSEVLEALEAYGIPELPEDREQLGEVISDRATWTFADHTCRYVEAMVKSWATENPSERHPWLLAQATRIAAARRLGCLSREGYKAAVDALAHRFRAVLATGQAREEGRGEINDAIAWGEARISVKSDEAARTELGVHEHNPRHPIGGLTYDAAVAPSVGTFALAPDPFNEVSTPPQLRVVSPDERPDPGDTLAHSDDANGLTLVERYGHVLRHCADRGRWYAWNGVVWEPCPRTAGPAREFGKIVARSLPERNEKDIAWKKKSLSAIGISAMLTQAASIEAVAVGYAELDAHPWELNTPGGIVDLRTGTLGPPDPAKLHTRLTLCTPDPAADRSAWLGFLDTTFAGDVELIAYMQRLVGYSAVGTVGAHVLPYCFGQGGNGKGVFLETCVRVLHNYATTAPAGFLMAKNFTGHETELARLAGARMVVCSEVNDDDRFDEARVKQLTGGDSITARFIAQDHFTFSPSHQLWSMGNYTPHVRAGGPSFWRRLRLIPFQHQVPEDQVIDDLQGILAGEHGPAVLSWIIEGAVAYHQHGLADPESVKAATGAYERDQDTVARFLEEMCNIGGAGHVQTKVALVRSSYESWCRESGNTAVSAKAFGTALQRTGIETVRTSSARLYDGLALVSDIPHLEFRE